MKKAVLIALTCAFVGMNVAKAQISFDDVKFWVGSGNDSATLVVNFNNGKTDSCVAWGYLFTDSVEAKTMLSEIQAADPNVEFFMGAFLDSIKYIGQSYQGGKNGFYWGMWTHTGSSWDMNSGITAFINNDEQLGMSYTDFSPTVYPVTAIAVNDPMSFTFADVQWWIGSGNDSSVLVVDFLDNGESHAWGFLHNGSITGKQMLLAIDAAEPNLEVYAGSFLDSIKFKGNEGINGTNFNYWNTWTADNMGGWMSNAGITYEVKNGEFFGCSFTGWPAFKPGVPSAVANSTSVFEVERKEISVYPNPASSSDRVEFDVDLRGEFILIVLDNTGRLVFSKSGDASSDLYLDAADLPNGLFFLELKSEGQLFKSMLFISTN